MRTLLTALTALMLFATPVVAGDAEAAYHDNKLLASPIHAIAAWVNLIFNIEPCG